MKPKVYLETTVISYLTARTSRDISIAGDQADTREWWENHRQRFDLYISDTVVKEIEKGDPIASQERLRMTSGIKELEITSSVMLLADKLLEGPIPKEVENDAFHISVSVVNGIDCLLTWNCRHISNPLIRRDIIEICEFMDYRCPIICSPREFLSKYD